MNLKDEIQTVIKRLEDIKNIQVPDIDSIREQVDDIEYNLLPQLDKKHDDEPSLVDAAADHLDSVWKGIHCAGCKRKDFCGDRISI